MEKNVFFLKKEFITFLNVSSVHSQRHSVRNHRRLRKPANTAAWHWKAPTLWKEFSRDWIPWIAPFGNHFRMIGFEFVGEGIYQTTKEGLVQDWLWLAEPACHSQEKDSHAAKNPGAGQNQRNSSLVRLVMKNRGLLLYEAAKKLGQDVFELNNLTWHCDYCTWANASDETIHSAALQVNINVFSK